MTTLTARKVALAEATLEELLSYATINLALEVPEKTSRSKTALLSLIQSVFHGDTISVVEAPIPTGRILADRPGRTRIRPGTEKYPPEPEDRSQMDDEANYQVTEYLIQIETKEGPGGRDPVPVNLNGRAMWIERGKPQWVRKEHLEILDHAIAWEYPENKNLGPNDLGGLDEAQRREVKRYPYNFV